MNELYYGGIYITKFGKISIIVRKNRIFSIEVAGINDFLYKKVTFYQTLLQSNDLSDKTAQELEEYFHGKRKNFSIPLDPVGSAFNKSVWEALLQIPYGTTQSYKEIACKIGKEKAYRAVGNASKKNPILFCIPCHRVIASNNQLSGYSAGIELKKKLLLLEQRYYF